MADEMSRGEVNDLLAGFATKNPEYRKALVEKPREVVGAQLGQTIPESVRVNVIMEKPDEFNVIIPYVAQEGEELSDADLEQVAGGFKDTYKCDIRGVGFGTRVEINASLF
ncbi:MAG: NHLP leader peptide family RiPP precursor [Thermoanaerobaculales bacterium]